MPMLMRIRTDVGAWFKRMRIDNAARPSPRRAKRRRRFCFGARSSAALLGSLFAIGVGTSVLAGAVTWEGDKVTVPLTTAAGDAARGKAVVVQREKGHCILCHTLPDPAVRFAGNVGPPLAGVGTRLSAAELRGR